MSWSEKKGRASCFVFSHVFIRTDDLGIRVFGKVPTNRTHVKVEAKHCRQYAEKLAYLK